MANLVAVLGDTHFGVRNDSQVFLDYFRKFYEDVFFPYLEEHDINVLIQVGDLVDHRKHINFNTAFQMRDMFLDTLQSRGIEAHFFIGNHDAYYKNTNLINAQNILLYGYNNIKAFSNPTTMMIGDTDFCIIPWINSENYEESMKVIEESKAKFCIGHLEIAGFEMYRGIPNIHGLDTSTFDKFHLTLSGHFHHRSKKGGIVYVGTPYEMTWQDEGDPRGFHILDTETGELEFIENPHKMFHKVYYDEDTDLEVPDFKNAFVKVVVKDKKNQKAFDRFMTQISGTGPTDISVVEDALEIDNEAVESLDKSTLEIINDTVDSLEIENDRKTKIKSFIHEVYLDALNLEV